MLLVFWNALSSLLGLLLIVSVGYVLAALDWFSKDVRRLIPRLITNISLPPLLMGTILRSFDRENLLQMVSGAFAPLLAIVATFLLAWYLCGPLGIERRHKGLFCACISNSNTIFIGIPVNRALFGPDSLHYVLLYYFAATIFLWSVGNWAIYHDADADHPLKPSIMRNIRNFFSPPMLAFITGIALVMSGIQLPVFVMDAVKYIGDLTIPLALIFIGITLQGIDLHTLRLTRDMRLALLGRLVASPLITALVLCFFPLPDLMCKVFIVQSALPVLTQAAILSAYYNTDPQFGSLMVSLSTIFCALSIPLLMCFI